MSSTRSASPASERGSPEPLTPRSKIRALLAAVDSSEDEGTKGNTKISPPQKASAAQASPALRSSASQSSDGSEDGSDEEIRPRGRLAARMMGAASASNSESPAKSLPLDASAAKGRDVEMSNASEDEDLPVARHRLQRRAPRSTTTRDTENAARSPSPSLFVSSPPQHSAPKPASDSENDLPALKSDRFRALVERKKQERLAREAAEEAKKAERRAQQEKLASEISQLDSDENDVSDIADDEGGLKLTQEARPTRKASKKAIEEMNRETQRMQRSMQLAHEAKTRKKISKNSLFERFNFKPSGLQSGEEPKTTSSSRPSTPKSDVEMADAETPPSSPPAKKAEGLEAPVVAVDKDEDELPQVDEVPALPLPAKDKGKAVAENESKIQPKRQVRVRFPVQPTSVNHVNLDSDDELEVTRTETYKLKALFDRVPKKTQESKSNQTLRALAQLHSPGKSGARNSKGPSGMTTAQLEVLLYQKARQQAKIERDRRLELLKAQGVVVQTAEEREKQMQEVDDIVAKAREEAEQLMRQERADAKKNGEEADPLAWDDSEDDDYEDREDPANEADVEIELSGSEDEEGEEEEEEEDENVDAPQDIGMLDEVADDAPESEGEEAEQGFSLSQTEAQEESEHQDGDEPMPTIKKRRRNQTAILSDDEDAIEATPKPKTHTTPTVPESVTPGSVLRSAKKSFIPGLPVQGPAGLGLTQMFAGTMDDSQMPASAGPAPTHSMMPDFDAFPDSNFSATAEAAEVDVEPATQRDTQTLTETQGVQLDFQQDSMHCLESLIPDRVPNTQASEVIEPSQDVGLVQHTPLKERFMDPPHSTVDTVVLDPADAQESPLVRRGRLRRKIDASIPEEELEPTAPVESTAFAAMHEAAQKEKRKAAIEEFNRKKSKAKEMVEEHAEESEDEYAGLGGYDGEESDNESIASVKEMIDDAAGNDADDRKIAAFYADRERANDEKQVEQLFKDITNGMLRRKRGADYDLSDSDDGGEARRKMKRRQFAKMQKALFSDERVKKMAENPGNQAFLKTIEDRGSDDEMDFLDYVEEQKDQESSQEASQGPSQTQEVVPDSQPLRETAQNKTNPRRTKNGKKPANIGEVRQTLSNLLEDEREASVIPATEAGSDSEDELADKENHQTNPRRTDGVVDRLSLKRQSSSNLSTSSSRLAFANGQTGSSSFKVPALLRRATTNSFKSTGSSTATTNSASGGFGDEAKIKKAAGKKSGISALAARESEQKRKIREGERRREAKKARGAERRVGLVGGLLGKGSFE